MNRLPETNRYCWYCEQFKHCFGNCPGHTGSAKAPCFEEIFDRPGQVDPETGDELYADPTTQGIAE